MTGGAPQPGSDDRSAASGPGTMPLLGVTAFVLLVAWTARLLTLRSMEASNPLFAGPILDEDVYLSTARSWAQGADRPLDLLSNLWPRMLALTGATDEPSAARLNVALGAIAAAVACAGAAILGRSILAGAVAGLLAGLWGGIAFYDVTSQNETLCGLLALSAALAAGFAARRPTAGSFASAGSFVALAAAARGSNLACALGVVVPWRRAFVAAGDRAGRLRAAGLGAVALLSGAAVLGLLAVALGLVPTGAGLNLWLGNNAYSRATRSYGTDEFALNPTSQDEAVRAVAEAAAGHALSKQQVNAWWTERAFSEMRADPAAAAGHFLAKAALVCTADEIGGVHDPIAEAEFAPLTRHGPVRLLPVLALGFAGWMIARRGRRELDGVGWSVVGLLLALVVIFPIGRYRAAAALPCCVLAGIGIADLAVRRIDRRDLVRAASVTAAIALSALAASWLRSSARPEAWTNLGIAATGAKRPEDAARWFRRAIDDDPRYVPALALHGDLLLDQRRNEEALHHLAAASDPANRTRWPDPWRNASLGRARALSNLGRHADADRANEALRAALPADTFVLAEWVRLALMRGDRTEARLRLDRAIATTAGGERDEHLRKVAEQVRLSGQSGIPDR